MIGSFLPQEDRNARVLVLGSMPGRASLAAGQYYAHPRNQFWPIMGSLFGFSPDISYQKRLDILKANRIALWDVLASCERITSLDAGIVRASETINDFNNFLAEHPLITDIFFNGRKAEETFLRKVKPRLPARELALHLFPSTSPAYAQLRFEEKRKVWEKLVRVLAG